ncbi:MAG: DUF1902 domain-containing protein [Lachnospiraceae bacterium]|nr:DUF1902 domain-containing protein [Lachnospiraceae bacterium]
MEYIVKCTWDPEAEVWWSECNDLPIGLESDTLDGLIKEIMIAAPDVAELNNLPQPKTLLFITEARKEVLV